MLAAHPDLRRPSGATVARPQDFGAADGPAGLCVDKMHMLFVLLYVVSAQRTKNGRSVAGSADACLTKYGSTLGECAAEGIRR